MKTQSEYLNFNHRNVYVKQAKIKALIIELEHEILCYNHKLFYPIPYFELKRTLTILKLAKKNVDKDIIAYEQLNFAFGF